MIGSACVAIDCSLCNAGIKNNTRATVGVRPGVARGMCGLGYQLTQLKVVADNIRSIAAPIFCRYISLYRLCWYINRTANRFVSTILVIVI